MPAIGPRLPDSLATITTDTGDFAPGPTAFSRYPTPGLCRAAALVTGKVHRRTSAAQAILDTIRETAPARDTLPTQAIAIARACGARFTVARTAAADLPDLFVLALLAQNDTLAYAAMRRRLALASSAAARDTVLLEAIGGYLAAEPARVAVAESVIAQADAFGPSAQAVRLAAHDSLLAFASSTFDTLHMRQEAERIITLGHQVPTAAIQYDYDPIVSAYEALGAVAFVMHPNSLLALAARAKQDLQRFPPGKDFPPGKPYWVRELLNYQTASISTILQSLSPIGSDQMILGQAPPALQATYWFPVKPAHWPRGPVSLIVYGQNGFYYDALDSGRTAYSLTNGCWGLNDGDLTKVARHSARGVAVTVVTETWRSGVGSLPTLTAHADTLCRDYLKLPVTVAVVADSLGQLPAPDGRRFPCNARQRFICRDSTANAKRYLNENVPLVLLGRNGQLLYAGSFSPLFEALLTRLLAAPTPAAATAGGGDEPH